MLPSMRNGFELGGAMAVGMTASAIVGVHPLLGSAMSAVAYLISQIAAPVFKMAPTFEDDGAMGGIATCAVWFSCAGSLAQISQWLSFCAGHTVRTLPSFAIVGSALFLGTILGQIVHDHLNPNAINEYD